MRPSIKLTWINFYILMHLYSKTLDYYRDNVTSTKGSFMDHCIFVMQSMICDMDELDSIYSLI